MVLEVLVMEVVLVSVVVIPGGGVVLGGGELPRTLDLGTR